MPGAARPGIRPDLPLKAKYATESKYSATKRAGQESVLTPPDHPGQESVLTWGRTVSHTHLSPPEKGQGGWEFQGGHPLGQNGRITWAFWSILNPK